MTHTSWGHAASTGLAFTDQPIVDAHFAACATHYWNALQQVGIQPGSRVLDAGCGSGAFLPWLAELAGPDGRISAIDLAAENVTHACARIREAHCAAEVRQGDIRDLPYADGEFDIAWCANTTQYLDDTDLAQALRELRRVVRPGGIIAVKDLDATLITVRPADPFLFMDFFRRSAERAGYARQLLRARNLYRWLGEAGLHSVRQHTMLIEHYAPLETAVLRFYGQACARIAEQAMRLGLGEEWRPLLDPEGETHPLRDPSGYLSEGNVIAIGRVPQIPR